MSSLVVLPTYNERENLEPMVGAILAQGPDIDVLIVDDNSPDGTGEIADRLARERGDSRLNVMHRAGKRGLGTAYLAGFAWALERHYEYIFEMDCDFSHDPADLPRLRAAIADGWGDVAVGARWVANGGTRNWSLLRTFISRAGSVYARLLLGVPINDLTSGFKCFSRRVLERIDLGSIHSNGYAFQVELNYRCHSLGFRIAQVPILFVDRRVGKSKMGPHIVVEAALVVLRLRLQTVLPSQPGSPARYSKTP